MRPLSVRVDAGMPCFSVAVRKVLTTSSPNTGWWAVQEMRYREWSSSQLRISTSEPSASDQWVKSDCQVSLGWSSVDVIGVRHHPIHRVGSGREAGADVDARSRTRPPLLSR